MNKKKGKEKKETKRKMRLRIGKTLLPRVTLDQKESQKRTISRQ